MVHLSTVGCVDINQSESPDSSQKTFDPQSTTCPYIAQAPTLIAGSCYGKSEPFHSEAAPYVKGSAPHHPPTDSFDQL